MKKILIIISVVTIFTAASMCAVFAGSALDYAESAPGGEVESVSDLIEAFGTDSFGNPNAELLPGSTNEIRLKNSVIVDCTIVIRSGSYTIVAGGCTIARSKNCGNIIRLEGASLQLERVADVTFGEQDEPNMIIDGQGETGESIISVKGNSRLTLNPRILIKNVEGNGNGGFISAEAEGSSIPEIVISACRFENCKAQNGGAVYFSGGMPDTESNRLIIKNTSFSSCYASEKGGALWTDTACVISDCEFNGNSASEGGAMYLGSAASLSNVDAEKNSAVKGGVVLVAGTASAVSFTAIENTGGSGAVVYNLGGCLISDAYFYDNSSDGDGGAIYNEGAFYYNGGQIFNNKCGGIGGGIYNTSSGLLKINSGEIRSNTADYAGAVYSEGRFEMNGGAIGHSKSEAPHVAILGSFSMGGSAVVYEGDVIGLVRRQDGSYPVITLVSVLTNKDKQLVARYNISGDGLKLANSPKAKIFEGASEFTESAAAVFSVEGGGLIPFRIDSEGVMMYSFPVALVIISASVILAIAVGTFVLIMLRKKKKNPRPYSLDPAESIGKMPESQKPER